jgi:hypothetical protein
MRRMMTILVLGLASFLLFKNRDAVERSATPWVKAYQKEYYTASLDVTKQALTIVEEAVQREVEPLENPFRESHSQKAKSFFRKLASRAKRAATPTVKTVDTDPSKLNASAGTIASASGSGRKWLPASPLTVRYDHALRAPVDECANCAGETTNTIAVAGIVLRSGKRFDGTLKRGDFRRGTPALYIE